MLLHSPTMACQVCLIDAFTVLCKKAPHRHVIWYSFGLWPEVPLLSMTWEEDAEVRYIVYINLWVHAEKEALGDRHGGSFNLQNSVMLSSIFIPYLQWKSIHLRNFEQKWSKAWFKCVMPKIRMIWFMFWTGFDTLYPNFIHFIQTLLPYSICPVRHGLLQDEP